MMMMMMMMIECNHETSLDIGQTHICKLRVRRNRPAEFCTTRPFAARYRANALFFPSVTYSFRFIHMHTLNRR